MKLTTIATAVLYLSLTALGSNAFAQDLSTVMEKVRYCKEGPIKPHAVQNKCIYGGKTAGRFSAFEDAGVAKQGQRNMYISVVSEPPRDRVRKVVLITAGQQVEDPKAMDDETVWGAGWPNYLVGQYDDYKADCMGTTQSCKRPIRSKSLAHRMISSDNFNSDDTLFILANDIRFGYYRTHKEKQRIEDAWWNFLTSKFDPRKVDLMVLAGQSRGGCMAFRLGSRFRKNEVYAKIPLVIQGYDPVCTSTKTISPQKAELPIDKSVFWHTNPLNEKYRSLVIDMDQVFPKDNRNDLSVLDLHGGQKVFFSNVRGFTWKTNDVDLGWWRQKWVNKKHSDMGGASHALPYTVDVGFPHLMAFIAEQNAKKAKFGSATSSFNGSLNTANVDQTGHYIVGVSDVTGDGRADLVSVHSDGNAYVWHGKVNGQFGSADASFGGSLDTANVDQTGHYIVGVSDVTGDGRADLVSVHSNGNAYVWPGESNGQFGSAAVSFGGSLDSANADGSGHLVVEVADVTDDGRSDLISVHSDGNAYVWPGTSSGKFGSVVKSFDGTLDTSNLDGSGHYIVGVSDVSGDGQSDLVSVHSNGNAYVWR